MKFICFLTLLFFSSTLFAQQLVLQADTLSHQKVHQLQPFLQIFEDKTNKLDLEEVRQAHAAGKFVPFAKDLLINGGTNYWLSFKIKTTYFRQTNWIVLPDGNFRGADELELYAISPNNVYTRKFGGALRKREEVEFIRSKYFLGFSLLQDTLPTTVYLKVRNAGNTPPVLTYRIGERDFILKEAENNIDRMNMKQSVFQGMIWIILIYNLLLFFSVKDKSYFYYALYLFAASIYFIFRNNFLILDYVERFPRFFVTGWFTSIGITSVLYLVFMRSFFNTAKTNKPIDKLLQYGIYFQTAVMGVAFLYVVITLDTYYALRFVLPPSVIQILLSIYILYRLRLEGGKIAKYFVRGSAFLLLSVILYNIAFFSVVQFRWVEIENFNVSQLNVLIEVGVVIEILFFSYGLGRKMQIAEQEKRITDEKLILQLQENDKLQTQVNRELEGKVQERTLKLNETIEELNSTLQLVNYQKREIEEKKESITASINYAKRIQTAMMPTEAEIQRTLPQSFVLFRPCDIVSGDFYYFSETIDKVIIAAVDCTGHGVPGAFMSMIGNEILNEIVNVKAIQTANLILEELHKGVRKALKQQDTDNKDGMDLALLVLHKTEKTLPNFQEISGVSCIEYAGAMNPLYCCDANGKLYEIKADKKPIGGSHFNEENDRKFTKNIIVLGQIMTTDEEEKQEKNVLHLPTNTCTLYLSTDGYQDQFGGEQNKKFMPRRLRELLVEVQNLDLQAQKQQIEQTFEHWLGNNEQIDDVLLIGLRINN
jgi:two-component system, sensor histidine kinase LadS